MKCIDIWHICYINIALSRCRWELLRMHTLSIVARVVELEAYLPTQPGLISFSAIVRCRRMLSVYFCSPGLQTVVDYLTQPHPSQQCPPDLLLRGLLVPAWGVESGSHTTPVTHRHFLYVLKGGFTGKVISRSAKDNLTIRTTGPNVHVKAQLSRLYEEALSLLDLFLWWNNKPGQTRSDAPAWQDANGFVSVNTWTRQRTIIQFRCNTIGNKLWTQIGSQHEQVPPCRALVILFLISNLVSVSRPMHSDLAWPVQAATQLEETKA